MKKILLLSTLFFSSLSLNLLASAADEHMHDSHHEDHAANIGEPGNPARVARTINVDMNDNMRFTPAMMMLKRGETVKFVIKNSGRIKHEMVFGSMQELQEHATAMLKNPHMQHADKNQVVVDPGKTGELVWKFTNAGTFDFACLEPGHFEAGMTGAIMVN